MMAGIRGRDTLPEVRLRSALHRRGFRFRLHDRSLPGRPDIVLPRWRAVVEVHGCFWHRHAGCRFATTPSTRPEFWSTKFDANVIRDRRNREALLLADWRVATIWECAVRGALVDDVADRLADWLASEHATIEIG